MASDERKAILLGLNFNEGKRKSNRKAYKEGKKNEMQKKMYK